MFCSQVYKPGTLACATQLLFQVLTQSIKVNIHREVSQCLCNYDPDLQGDGTAFWLCLTRVIFPNTEIFTASIKPISINFQFLPVTMTSMTML